MIVTPVAASPAISARSIGAAPRQRGIRDGCTLSIGHSLSSGSLISCPKAQTAIGLGLGRPDRLHGLGRVHVRGLMKLQAQLAGRLSGRRRRRPAPAALAAVRRRDDERRPVRAVGEAPEHRRRELGGA